MEKLDYIVNESFLNPDKANQLFRLLENRIESNTSIKAR